MNHGGAGTTYVHYGCRCDVCREANRSRNARRRAERVAAPKDPNDKRHGTPSFYANHGCRCDRCKSAWKTECKRIYDQRKARAAA